MIVGEATAEKLIISDYVQPLYNAEDLSRPPMVAFFDGNQNVMFGIPCKSLAEATELADRFQIILSDAVRKAGVDSRTEEKMVADFARLYYEKGYIDGQKMEAQTRITYKGIQMQKCPLDLQIYHEIIWENKPDLIIECGTADGASALWLADQLTLNWHNSMDCKVISIDIMNGHGGLPIHPRLEFITGSTLDEEVLRRVRYIASGYSRVMVILDDDHHANHVAQELERYPALVSVGQYLIVEDTNVNGEPIMAGYGAGPQDALREWLKTRNDFVVDRTREKLFLTWNPGGYLKRVA